MIETTAKYIYTVYRLKSVSLAAQELYISQPALSRAIKKAEKELGAPIFNRKTHPFSLTAEGKVYIEAIEKMLQIQREAAEKVSDIRHMQGGALRIATSTHLSFYAIPKILKAFQKQHPQIDTHIIFANTDKLYEHLQKETADLVFTSGGTPPEDCCTVELFTEKFVVAMPPHMVTEVLLPYALSHNELINANYDKYKEVSDLSFFHGIEFIYSPPNTNIQKKRKLLFGKSDISPYITSNAGRQQFNFNLMCSGFGALLTTDANIATMPPDSKCVYFVLGNSAGKQSFSITYPQKDSGHIVNEFVTTAKALFSCENPLLQLSNA